MPRPRFHKLPASKRDAILDAARAEFSEHGFSQASQNRIIERAQISKGALYYYFDDKDDLYVTVLRREFAGIAEAFALPSTDSAEQFWLELEQVLLRAYAAVGHSPEALALARSVARSWGRHEISEGLLALMGEISETARMLVVRGQRIGAVRDDLPVDLLVALVMKVGEAMDIWFAENAATLPHDELESLTNRLAHLFERIMRP